MTDQTSTDYLNQTNRIGAIAVLKYIINNIEGYECCWWWWGATVHVLFWYLEMRAPTRKADPRGFAGCAIIVCGFTLFAGLSIGVEF